MEGFLCFSVVTLLLVVYVAGGAVLLRAIRRRIGG